MATSNGASFKELHKLIRTIDKLTTGQARIDVDAEDVLENETDLAFVLLITPSDGYYKGATIKFKVVVPELYPETPPMVTCLNHIYHPNIDLIDFAEPDGTAAPVCVSLLDSDWEPGVGLDGCVMAILFLFYHPNLDDALSPVFDSETSEEEFESNVRASLRGEEVEGITFEKLISNEDDHTENDRSNPENEPSVGETDCQDGADETGQEVNEDVHEDSGSNTQALVGDQVRGKGDADGNTNLIIPMEKTDKDERNGSTADVKEQTESEEPEGKICDKKAAQHPEGKSIQDIGEFNMPEVISDNHNNRGNTLQIIDASQLAIQTKGIDPHITWHKALSIFGRFYRWLKGCTGRQSYDVYVIGMQNR